MLCEKECESMPVQKKITTSYSVRKSTSYSTFKGTSPSKRPVQDENCNKSKDEASSPSKRTKSTVDAMSPSLMLQRLPLSPRKDYNLSSPVHQPHDRSSTPNTLPKTSSQNVVQTLRRTRRNLASNFASLTSDSSSFVQQRYNSVDEIRDLAHTYDITEGGSKVADVVLKSTVVSVVTSTTPSKSCKKVATPSKSVAEPTRLTTTSSKTAEISKHELATMRLIKDSGECYQKTKAVLHSALPSDALIGRASESKVIDEFLVEHISKMVPGSMYVSGAPGTGKTAVLMKAIEQLQVESSDRCRVVFINCMSLRSAHSIHQSILSALLDRPVSLSAKQAAADVECCVTTSKSMILLVLDEMDSLDCKSQEVLYTLFEYPSLTKSKLILIGIANSLDLTDRVLPRLHTKTRCRPKLLHFAPYSRNEIAAILDSRLAKVGGSESVLESSAVQMCARKVAAVAGDARTALDVCRRAVEAVESDTRRQLKLGCESPSKRHSSAVRKVGLKDVLKVINDVTSSTSRLVSSNSSSSSSSVTLPLQQTVAVCTLLMMTDDNRMSKHLVNNEVTLGKFHECFCRVCRLHGVAEVSQSEFLSLCQNIEAQGIFSLKKTRDTRSTKVYLKMLREELETILQDKTLMSSILHKGVPS